MKPDKFYLNYEENGFYFPKSTLTTYCLSLFTKPFVILSGISGTGKTKIAQFFSIPDQEPEDEITTTKIDDYGNWIVLNLTRGIMDLDADGRANFKYEDLRALLTEQEIKDLEPEMKRLIEEGKTNNFSGLYDLTIETPEEGDIKAKFYLQRPQSPLVRVRFRSKRGEEHYDSTQYFKKYYKINDIIKMERAGDKRLRIISVNDEDVRKKYKELEKEEIKYIENQCFISVKSDWTDSTSLFGYYNLVEQKYHITRLLKFILKARENPELPFFLILDEMNLSKVEYYFSDFLSCLESRYEKGGQIFQEKIQLHSASGFLETDDEYFDMIPCAIELPLNLFVSGTVNIDETTYMFSPKVLDRANVIEFNEVNLENYVSESSSSSDNFVLSKFPNFNEIKLASRQDYFELKESGKKILKEIHSVLEKYNLHFGYRTINEISLYLNNSMRYINNSETILTKALDYQIVQKILPKIHGGHSKLDLPLRELMKTLIGVVIELDKVDFDFIEQIKPKETKFPISISKIQRMYKNLILNGFTSFIE